MYDKIAEANVSSNDLESALPYYLDALQMRQKKYENTPNHADIARSLSNLADVYMSLNKTHEAFEYYTRCLDIHQKLYIDVEQPNETTASLLNKIGNVYVRLNEFNMALKFFLDCLNMQKCICGVTENHPSIAHILFSIGCVYFVLENLKFALSYFEKALDMFKAINANSGGLEDSVDVAACLQKQGDCYAKNYNYSKALECYLGCVEMKTRLAREYPDQNVSIGQCLNCAGVTFLALHDAKNALIYFKKSLEIRKTLHKDSGAGSNQADLAESLNNVGVAYQVNCYKVTLILKLVNFYISLFKTRKGFK